MASFRAPPVFIAPHDFFDGPPLIYCKRKPELATANKDTGLSGISLNNANK